MDPLGTRRTLWESLVYKKTVLACWTYYSDICLKGESMNTTDVSQDKQCLSRDSNRVKGKAVP
jgi:hypothetical protein